MPIYEYCCESCGHYEELLEKITAPTLRKCPACSKRKFKRLVSLSSFQLKGDGWYVTDFRDKGKKPEAKSADKEGTPDKPDKAKSDKPGKEEIKVAGSKKGDKAPSKAA